MVVLKVLFLLGSLFLCGQVEALSETIDMLREAALQYQGSLPCDKWDCNCTFTRQRGCCCAVEDMFQIEDETFMRIKHLWHDMSAVRSRVQELSDGVRVAFKATMDPNMAIQTESTVPCFGPFNTNVPIPYTSIASNYGGGYNPSMGVFTAPWPGVYAFSSTVYSYVEKDMSLYYKVQLMMNGRVVASVWEHNREDGEDSATQFVILEMKRGDQVYMELTSGRKLCKHLQYNIFTGYMLYPHIDEQPRETPDPEMDP